MARCYQFVGDLNDMAPVKNLCKLRYGGSADGFLGGFGRRECWPLPTKRLPNSMQTNTGEIR